MLEKPENSSTQYFIVIISRKEIVCSGQSSWQPKYLNPQFTESAQRKNHYLLMPLTFQGIDDKYITLNDEGIHGGAGIAYKAIAATSSRSVMIKIPRLVDVLPQDIEDRIFLLNKTLGIEGRILPKLLGINGVAQLVDQGLAKHPGGSLRFNAYEFIEGVTLRKWCDLYARTHGQKEFKGIQEFAVWESIVTSLLKVLAEVHTRKVVHGDIHPGNVMVRNVVAENFNPIAHTDDLVLLDFGWGFALNHQSTNSANRSVWFPAWAPERVKYDGANPRWYTPVDIYSLGHTLLFLAAGDHDLIPFQPRLVTPVDGRPGAFEISSLRNEKTFRDDYEIKAEISRVVKANNPSLCHEFPALAEIIMYCMRPHVEQRAKHAGTVLRQLAALSPVPDKSTFSAQAFQQTAENLSELARKACARGVQPMLLKVLERDLEAAVTSLSSPSVDFVERHGDRDALILDLTTCLAETRSGDTIRAILTFGILQAENLGPTGRFISSLATARRRGVKVEIVVLIKPEDEKTVDFKDLCGEFLRRIHECEDIADHRFGFSVKKLVWQKENYEQFIKENGSLIMVESGKSVVIIDADFTISGGRCTSLRFSYKTKDSLVTKGLIEIFKKCQSDASGILEKSDKRKHPKREHRSGR